MFSYENYENSSQENVYVCNLCGRRYKQKRNLMAHVRLECGKEAQFPCQFCSYKAKRKAHLKNHMLLRHSTPLTNW